jgi:hypothetical protein
MDLSINTLLVIAIVALVVLVGARAYTRKSREDKPTPAATRNTLSQRKPATTRTTQPQRKPVAKNPFRAVSIEAPDTACAAAKAIAGKRFLVAEHNVPQLPLGECDAASCTCTYAHHPDRREEQEIRRAPAGLRTQLHAFTDKMERRKRRGRRSTDWE